MSTKPRNELNKRRRRFKVLLTVIVCTVPLGLSSQVVKEAPTAVDRILVKLHPVASADADKKALTLLMGLFEPEKVPVEPGTRLTDLSRGRCGRIDNNWISVVLKQNPSLSGPVVKETTTLSLPPCPFWETERSVEIPKGRTLSHLLISRMGTLGHKTMAQVASANDRPVETLDEVKPGDVIKLPYVTAYNAYTLKQQYRGHSDTVTAALAQIPGYVDNMPQRIMTLITAASDSDCVAPIGAAEWPFSTEKLRNILEYNNTKRSHPLTPAVIAIADTGIDPNEDRLFLKINQREVPDNKIDDDENGYIDDVKGANMDRSVTGFPSLNDGSHDSEHGTHVSGIALGGLSDDKLNKLVKERIQIEELNIVRKDVRPGPSGLTTTFPIPNDYLLDAFQYALQESAVQIINLSVENDQSSGLEGSLAGAPFLVVAAAGNDDGLNIDENEKYPAAAKNRDRLISVAAYDGSGALAKFSNWGHSNVDLAAPGCQIDSILPGGRRGRLNGTSQSAPLVSFTAGLLYAEGLAISQIKDRILLTTEIDRAKLGDCTGTRHCVASEGRLDIINALNVYQDILAIHKSDGSEGVLYGHATNCIKVDARCYAVRTQLKRLVHDPDTGENTVWIKSTDNQTHKRPCQIDPTSNINFQETGSQVVQSIPMSELVDFVPGVY